MAAEYSDFTISFTRGDTHRFQFVVKDKLTGVLQDITAWPEFWVTAKIYASDPDSAAVFQLKKTLGTITLPDPTHGVGQGNIAPTNTTALDDRKYNLFGDIQGKDAQGNIWTLARGIFAVGSDVTRATS